MINIIGAQLLYVLDALRAMEQRGLPALDVRPEVQERWERRPPAHAREDGVDRRRLRELVPHARGRQPDAVADVLQRVLARDARVLARGLRGPPRARTGRFVAGYFAI